MAVRSFKLNVGFHRHKVGGQRAFAKDSGAHDQKLPLGRNLKKIEYTQISPFSGANCSF